ncbi:DUF262 domain-containing protein [Campylobacter sp. 2018MI01]|uniref:DUF262 domain-containing protein n=1 Tax=Campylobacter sp. 2018MI01 TaxID=2836735 RepID=UPI001BDA98FA|nr:DUF262 domain-containing protein [Campylobacter sp. 2018MI01]MBT0878606.1 DUF262 domain-containing protein [Campylobacter sp. 2018MI01]
MDNVSSSILTFDKLTKLNLSIPDYQRPYVWELKQIKMLLKDIENSKSGALLGSIILHEIKRDDKTIYEVIDGQQRLTTIKLILMVLSEYKIVMENHNGYSNYLSNVSFFHKISQDNIKNNYEYIKNYLSNEDKAKDFLEKLEKTQFIIVATTKADDAFIFFDNTNSKGKKLENYDLIKAFHLQSIKNEKMLNKWAKYYEGLFEEKCKTQPNIKTLLLKFLIPTRLWIKGSSRDNKFDKVAFNELCNEDLDGKRATNIGILSNYKYGDDFFKYLKKYEKIYKSILENNESFNPLWKPHSKVGNLNTFDGLMMCLVLCESKFKNSKEISPSLSRVVYSHRLLEDRVNCPKNAKDLVKHIYFASYASEVEKLLEKKGQKCQEEELKAKKTIKAKTHNELTAYLDNFYKNFENKIVYKHKYNDEREK